MNSHDTDCPPFFAIIAQDIMDRGYSVQQNALPLDLAEKLWEQLFLEKTLPEFKKAGIGRQESFAINSRVRTDAILWIAGDTKAEEEWLLWANSLQIYLNRRLILGLFSFESHFAKYETGGFYETHKDAFQGEDNRKLSIVIYLNKNWQPENAGELVLFTNEEMKKQVIIAPEFGTIAVFLSEEFPHEVLPTNSQRLSIAGWFRVNQPTMINLTPVLVEGR